MGTIISFRVGIEDARFLAQEFYPVLDEIDLINLSNYHIYLKLMVNGVTSQAFSATTLPPPKRKTSYSKEVIETSKKRYTRPRKAVEMGILFRTPIKTGYYDQKISLKSSILTFMIICINF